MVSFSYLVKPLNPFTYYLLLYVSCVCCLLYLKVWAMASFFFFFFFNLRFFFFMASWKSCFLTRIFGTEYSRMNQVKFAEDSPWIWRDLVCLSFKLFKGCLPQILLGQFLNTLAHLKKLFEEASWRSYFLTIIFEQIMERMLVVRCDFSWCTEFFLECYTYWAKSATCNLPFLETLRVFVFI